MTKWSEVLDDVFKATTTTTKKSQPNNILFWIDKVVNTEIVKLFRYIHIQQANKNINTSIILAITMLTFKPSPVNTDKSEVILCLGKINSNFILIALLLVKLYTYFWTRELHGQEEIFRYYIENVRLITTFIWFNTFSFLQYSLLFSTSIQS